MEKVESESEFTTVWIIYDHNETAPGLHVAWASKSYVQGELVPRDVEVWRFSPWLPNEFNLVKDEDNKVFGLVEGATHAERTRCARAMWSKYCEKYEIMPGTKATEWYGDMRQGGQLRKTPGSPPEKDRERKRVK